MAKPRCECGEGIEAFHSYDHEIPGQPTVRILFCKECGRIISGWPIEVEIR